MSEPMTPVDLAVLSIRNLASTILENQQRIRERGVHIPPRVTAFDEECARLLAVAARAIESGEIS